MDMPVTDRIAEFIAALESQDIKYVRFEIPDMHGVSRSKLIPINSVEGYIRKGLIV